MDHELLLQALEARKRSYAPYSHYCVGAALLCGDGKVYTGSNIENAAYSPSLCAERVAFAKAISDLGAAALRPQAIAIVGAPEGQPCSSFCTPCGVCRQVMAEFCKPDFRIISATTDASLNIIETKQYTLGELLPESFSL